MKYTFIIIPLPVDADGTQVENACSAHHHIQGYKDITVQATEEPISANHLHRYNRVMLRD